MSSEGPGLWLIGSAIVWRDGVAVGWMGLSCLKLRSFCHRLVPAKTIRPVPWDSLCALLTCTGKGVLGTPPSSVSKSLLPSFSCPCILRVMGVVQVTVDFQGGTKETPTFLPRKF